MQQDVASPTANRVAELERAFSAFTATSLQLETAYHVLEQRVEVLSAALAKAHDERLIHLAEKERIADRLQGLLETLPAAVIVLDGDDRIRDFNPGAVALFDDTLAGRGWTEIVQQHFSRGGNGSEFRLRDGRVVIIAARKLEAQAGRILLLTDVTETRHLQQSLARHLRLSEMGEMNARLAHQLRTPLATAVLYVSQLKKPDASKRSRRYANKCLDSLRLLERMVNDMLRFAGGAQTATHEQVDINDLFAGVAVQMKSQLRDGIELEFGAPPGLLLTCDREALIGALLNLTTNAVQSCGEPMHVVVDAVHADDHIALRVSDDGPGIAVEDREKIFAPFYSTRPHGTGLGLAVVASVTRAHGGRVTVSNSDSGGARFSILMPCSNHSALRSGPTTELHNLTGEPS